jgi:hypothetical protein
MLRDRPLRLARLSGLRARLSLLLRVLAVLLGVQLGGIGHAAADALHETGIILVEEHEECPLDRACDDCPPGCPQCHCSNRVPSVAPLGTFVLASALPRADVTFAPTESGSPPRPELPSLYRPPRSSAGC